MIPTAGWHRVKISVTSVHADREPNNIMRPAQNRTRRARLREGGERKSRQIRPISMADERRGELGKGSARRFHLLAKFILQ
jgi:hypothetical protein